METWPTWKGTLTSAGPSQVAASTKSVVSLLFNYHNDSGQTDPNAPKLAQYAYGEDYHFVLKWKLKELPSGCARNGERSAVGCT